MPTNHHVLLRFFFKVSLLTIVFSLLRVVILYEEYEPYNDHHFDDTPLGVPSERKIDTTSKSSEVDAFIEETVSQVLDDEHSAAPSFPQAKQRYDQVCTQYDRICEKTNRNGSFSMDEKLMYQALMIHLIKYVNSYLDTEIDKKLTSISLSKTSLGRRGSAGHAHIKMNVKLIPTPNEFREVFVHELGHIVDFSVITGASYKKDSNYTEFGKIQRPIDDPSLDYYKISRLNENTRKNTANETSFVSGYGMRGMYEDLAEAHNLRFNHNTYFKKLAGSNTDIQKKYDYFYALYRGRHYTDITSSHPTLTKRAWDTTKLNN